VRYRLYRRPNSPNWWVGVGAKHRLSTGTADRGEAEEFAAIFAERIWRTEKLGDPFAISFAQAAAKWLIATARSKKRDREMLAWLLPRIGNHPVSAVADREALEELRADALADGWAHSTCDRMMGTVSAVLRHAGLFVKVPMFRPAVPEPRWLTPEQFEALCKELPLHLELAARFAVLTMLRMRSMLQLTWERVDIPNRRIWIPGSQMKTRQAVGLPLSQQAIAVLGRCRRLAPESPYVFTYKGRPFDDANTRAFKLAVQRAGVGPLNWHSLRHTGCSWAVQAGVPLLEVMRLGGWRSYSMVVNRYAHLAPDHLADAAQRLANSGKIQARRRATQK